jgi:ketosteroid isomerase-like protein
MARTPQEIFEQHGAALGAGDIDRLVADYTDDAVFITPRTVRHGKDGVREGITELLTDLPDAEWNIQAAFFEKDVLFLAWSAVSGSRRARDGADTFVFDGELIRVQTVRYTLESTT